MDHGQVELVPDDSQAAKDSLEDYAAENGNREPAKASPLLGSPRQRHQHDAHESHGGSGQAMDVLEEDVSLPVADGEEEHVIAVAVGPIGDGHAGVVAGDEAADEDQ